MWKCEKKGGSLWSNGEDFKRVSVWKYNESIGSFEDSKQLSRSSSVSLSSPCLLKWSIKGGNRRNNTKGCRETGLPSYPANWSNAPPDGCYWSLLFWRLRAHKHDLAPDAVVWRQISMRYSGTVLMPLAHCHRTWGGRLWGFWTIWWRHMKCHGRIQCMSAVCKLVEVEQDGMWVWIKRVCSQASWIFCYTCLFYLDWCRISPGKPHCLDFVNLSCKVNLLLDRRIFYTVISTWLCIDVWGLWSPWSMLNWLRLALFYIFLLTTNPIKKSTWTNNV